MQAQERLSGLQAKLDGLQARKQQLEDEVAACERKVTRAANLIGGLASEKARWVEAEAQLACDGTSLVGDVLLACGCVAYLGAFTAPYRCAAVPCCPVLTLQAQVRCTPAGCSSLYPELY